MRKLIFVFLLLTINGYYGFSQSELKFNGFSWGTYLKDLLGKVSNLMPSDIFHRDFMPKELTVTYTKYRDTVAGYNCKTEYIFENGNHRDYLTLIAGRYVLQNIEGINKNLNIDRQYLNIYNDLKMKLEELYGKSYYSYSTPEYIKDNQKNLYFCKWDIGPDTLDLRLYYRSEWIIEMFYRSRSYHFLMNNNDSVKIDNENKSGL